MNYDLIPYLTDLLIRGALVLSIFAVISIFLRRSSAALLRRFWRCALLALLAASALTLAPPVFEFRSFASTSTPEHSALIPADAALPLKTVPGSPFAPLDNVMGLAPSAPATPPASADSRSESTKGADLGLPALLALGWLAGALFIAVRKLIGTLGVVRLRRAAELVDHPDWQRDLAALRDSCGVRAPVQLRHHLALRSPIVTGIRNPTIILPADFAAYSARDRRAVLLHELAHVRHRDAHFRWVALIARILHWPNPLVWYAERSLRLAEERSSDDAVLHGGIAAPQYAELLARLAKGGAPLVGDLGTMGESAMAQPSNLLPRVHAILRARQTRRQPGQAASLTLATATVALAVLGGGSVLVSADPQNQPEGKPAAAKAKPANQPDLGAKLHSIVIPLVDFNEATLDEVIDFIRRRSRELDPDKRGINIISKLPKLTHHLTEGPNADLPWIKALSRKINLRLEHVPLDALLDFVCLFNNASWRTADYAVVIAVRDSQNLESKNFRIPAEIFARELADPIWRDLAGAAEPDPFAAPPAVAKPKHLSARDWLQHQGVAFPPGTSAFYTKAAGTLHVRNVPPELEFIERIIASLNQDDPSSGMNKADAQRLAAVKRALRDTIIPVIDFDSASLPEALEFLRVRARELVARPKPINQDYVESKHDYEAAKAMLVQMKMQLASKKADQNNDALAAEVLAQEAVVEKRRKLFQTIVKSHSIQDIFEMALVQFVLDVDPKKLNADPKKSNPIRITLKLRDVPLGVALKHIIELAHLQSVVTPYGIMITDVDGSGQLHLAGFQLSPANMKRIRESIGNDSRTLPIDILRNIGIEFPEGTGAFWNSRNGDLLVRNTIASLAQLESFLEGLEPPKSN